MAKISKSTLKEISKGLDKLIKWKKVWEEKIDGVAISFALNVLNNKFGDNIPDSYNPVIDELVKDLTAEDYAEAEKKIGSLLAELIKTPLIDGTPEEVQAYQTVVTAAVNFFLGLGKKK